MTGHLADDEQGKGRADPVVRRVSGSVSELTEMSFELRAETGAHGPREPEGDTPLGGDAAVGDAPSLVKVEREKVRGSLSLNRIPLGTILATVGIIVAVYLAGKILYRLRDIALVMVVSGFIALLLNPLVVALQRRGLRRRGFAVAVVTLIAVIVIGALGFAFGYPLVNGLTHFAHALPTYVKQAEEGHGWIGHLVRRFHIESWVKKNSPKLVSFAESLSKPIISAGKGAISVVASLVVMFVLVLLLLLESPKMRRAILSTRSEQSAIRWRRLGREISRTVSGFMLGDLATSIIAGVVVLVTLMALSVPYALLWALWVALVDFLPEVGGALALIPTVLFAFTHSLTAGIVSAVVLLVYWQLENRLLNPVIMSRTTRVNPLLVFVAVIVGAGIGSWVGGIFGGFAAGLIAIPAAAAGQVIVRELRQPAAPQGVEPAPPAGDA
jgi:predicted PurR-regulated permease PerM